MPPDAPDHTPTRAWWIAVVRGRSMQPTLAESDRLLVRSTATRARTRRPAVRRPAASSLAVGRLAVVRLPERSVSVKRLAFREGSGWWVERDNPREGIDSWNAGVGAIPDADVLGVVVARLWPRPRRF